MSALQQSFAEAMERAPRQCLRERAGNCFHVALPQVGEMREAQHSSAEILRHRQRLSRKIPEGRLRVASGPPPGSAFNAGAI